MQISKPKLVKSFICFFGMLVVIPTAFADQMSDIVLLMQENKIERAFQLLYDVPASKRGTEWNDTVKKIVLTYATATEKNDVSGARSALKKSMTDYPFLAQDSEVKSEYIRISLADVRQHGNLVAYSDQKNAFIDELTHIDPAAIYTVVIQSGITDERGILISYLLENSSKYKNDEKVRKYLVNAEISCLNGGQKYLKFRNDIQKLILQYGLQNEIDKHEKEKKLIANNDQKEFLNRIVRGEMEYKNYDLDLIIYELNQRFRKKGDLIEDQHNALYLLAALVYPFGQLNVRLDDKVVPMLATLPAQDIKKAESEILKVTRPEKKWFTSFDDVKHYKNLQKFAPRVLEKVLSEYKVIKQDKTKKSEFITSYVIKTIDEIQKEMRDQK